MFRSLLPSCRCNRGKRLRSDKSRVADGNVDDLWIAIICVVSELMICGPVNGRPNSVRILLMTHWFRYVLGWLMLIGVFRSRQDLLQENLALRQQLLALDAKKPRPRLRAADKLF